jgi:predicted DNA-binding transcriptional regulator YafY
MCFLARYYRLFTIDCLESIASCLFSRWYMIYGDRATIIEPVELNEMVAQTAQSILEKLGRKSLTAKARGREVSPGMNA